MYDTSMETEVHHYSSSGPTYETIDTIEGLGQNYSVLEQCKESSKESLKTMTEDIKGQYNHVLESGEHEGVTGRVCDYEVPVSGKSQGQAN